MVSQYRFIEAELCPMMSKGGWMVPQPRALFIGNPLVEPAATIIETKFDLSKTGLTEGVDYKIIGQGWNVGKTKYEALKRVVFFTDEAFIMAKMTIT